MGIFTTLERRDRGPGDDFWYRPVAMPVAAGIDVTEETALTSSAVWAAVNVISIGLGSLPMNLMHEISSRKKEVAHDHPAQRVVHRRPNGWQTAFEYREMTQGHILTRGNGYSQIVRDRGDRLTDLIPLHPARIKPRVKNGVLVYIFDRPDGTERIFPADEILHLRGLSPNGILGYCPITLARESIGLTLAAERHGATLFGNDARPGGVLETPAKLDEKQKDNLRNTWALAHSGDNAHSVAVLEDGLAWKTVGFSSEDAQFLETRQFQIAEVARWFNVPPHKLRDLLRATFTNIEQQNIEWVVDTMRPWAERWEQRYDISLLTEQEQAQGFFFKLNLEALLRGDSAARAAFYTAMWQMGVFSTNDIRDLEDMDEVEGGDQRFVPMNMMLLEDAGIPIPSVDVPPADDTRALPAGVDLEQREQRSVKLRRRYQVRFDKVFRDAGARIVARETKGLRRIIKAELGERGVPEFNEQLTTFYDDLSEYIKRQMNPILDTYGDLVQAAAAEEIGNDPEMTDELRQFLRDYVDAMTLRHVERSKGQLEAIVRNTPPDELEGALSQRLDEWEEKRPAKIGIREAVQAGAAIAMTAWAGASVSVLVWRTVGENCPLCNRMNGRRVSITTNFLEKGDEVQPLYPNDEEPLEGDPRRTNPLRIRKGIGHPPLHGKCVPGDTLVSARGRVSGSSERWYDGNLVVVRTASGKDLSCTPNHPILTPAGWVEAHLVNVGDGVVSGGLGDRDASIIGDHQDVPIRIEEFAKAFGQSGDMLTVPMPGTSEDFHNDGVDGEVTIIRTDRELLNKLNATGREHLGETVFHMGDAYSTLLPGPGSTASGFVGVGASPPCGVCGSDLRHSLGGGHLARPDQTGGATATYLDASGSEAWLDSAPSYPELLSQGVEGPAGVVFADEVVDVEIKSFNGLVFNLETEHGLYIANGIVTHNCDCIVTAGR